MAAPTVLKMWMTCHHRLRNCFLNYKNISICKWSGVVSQYRQSSSSDLHQAEIGASERQNKEERSQQKQHRVKEHQTSIVRSPQHSDEVTASQEQCAKEQEWFHCGPEKDDQRKQVSRKGYRRTGPQDEHRADLQRQSAELINGGELEEQTFFQPIQHDKAAQEMSLIQVPKQPANPHLLKVAIIGDPNAGKSTLINSLLGRRIFSVSDKVHTTRSKAFAVVNQGNKQIIILDTPGIVDYKAGRRHHLARSLLVDAKNSFMEADLVAVLVDTSNRRARQTLHFDILKQLSLHPHLKSILLLNKVDLVKPKKLLVDITSRLTNGKVSGQSYQITKEAAAKMGSVERRSFMKLSYRAPSPDKQMTDDVQVSVESHSKTHEDNVDPRPEALQEMENMKSIAGEQHNNHIVDSSQLKNYALDCTQKVVTVESSDNPVESSDNPVESSDNPVESSDNPVESSDNPVESSDNPVESFDEIRTDSTLPDDSSENGTCNHSSKETSDFSINATTHSSREGRVEQSSKADIMEEYVESLQQISTFRLGNMENAAMEMKAEEERATAKAAEKELHTRLAKMHGWDGFDAVFMLSAKYGDGVKDIKSYLLDQAMPQDWEYHSDVITNLSPEEIVIEAIREQLLETLRQEIPYLVEQRNDFWGIGEHGELKIVQELICPRNSHARILKRYLGKIAIGAQQQLMNAFHCEINLQLGLSVDKNRLRRLGL